MSSYEEKPEGFIYGADEPRSRPHGSRFETGPAKSSKPQKAAKNQAAAQNKKRSKAN